MKLKQLVSIIAGLICLSSCKKYLNVVPDNVPTLDYAFRTSEVAKKALFTCYSFVPQGANLRGNPALLGGDELWIPEHANSSIVFDLGWYWKIARGQQNIVKPVDNPWSWDDPLFFVAIRHCNTFLDNIGMTPMEPYRKKQWIGEVQFLKAFFHWQLLVRYGPIPIIDKNLPASVSVADAQLKRLPVDSCFQYINNLLDTAVANLPDILPNPAEQLGRITRPIALSIKARILTAAASPLFNGNPDYANFKDKSGVQLFNPTYDPQKWVKAAEACRVAIDASEAVGAKLNVYTPTTNVSELNPEMQVRMDLRTILTTKWNQEMVWGYLRGPSNTLQEMSSYPYNGITANASGYNRSALMVPLKIAKMFYTRNGLPIDQDKTLDFHDIAAQREATYDDRFKIAPGYTTARLNFDRESRFYAALGFDGGILYGAGNFVDSTSWHYEAKAGQYSSKGIQMENYTGYFPKKFINYNNVMTGGNSRTTVNYPWPEMRLADLYLLYAETLNEANGPGGDVYQWINLVRQRAGIPTVEESWTNYSTNPSEHTTKDGLRRIIHREREVELVFEQRFYDLRRWKEAERAMNEPIQGWDGTKADPDAYYRIVTLFNRTFLKRDYLWPLRELDLEINLNLVQNPGW